VSGHPTCSWGSAGPEGRWAPGKQVSRQAVGLAQGWGLVQIGGRDPSGCGSSGVAKGQVSRHGVGPGTGGQYC
jgi:hypothetical protein